MAPSGGMQRQQASAFQVAPALGHMVAGAMLYSNTYYPCYYRYMLRLPAICDHPLLA